MSSAVRASRFIPHGDHSDLRIRMRREAYGSRWQRMRRQAIVVVRHEITLGLHLLLLAFGGLMWVPRLNDDFNLWTTLDRDIVTGAFLLTIAASTVAFLLGQRDMRNAITELYACTVASRHDVVLARMIGMVLTTWLHLSILVAGMYAAGLLSASWGRPDVRILLPIFLWPVFAMPLLVAIAEWSTHLNLPQIVVLLVATLVAWFVHVVVWNPFLGVLVESVPWPSPPPQTVPGDMAGSLELGGALWQWLLVGLAMLVAALLALPGRFGDAAQPAKITGIAACVMVSVSLFLAMPLGMRNGDGYARRVVSGELDSCVSRSLFTACTHPAYATLIDSIDDDIAEALAPIAGTSLEPIRLDYVPSDQFGDRLSETFGPHPPTDPPDTLLLPVSSYGYHSDDFVQEQMVRSMFTNGPWSIGDDTVRIVIQAWWLQELGYTSESSPQVASAMGEPWSDVPGYEPPDLSAYIERFAALSPDEQSAWLEANWDALRAGDLTLEDLP